MGWMVVKMELGGGRVSLAACRSVLIGRWGRCIGAGGSIGWEVWGWVVYLYRILGCI